MAFARERSLHVPVSLAQGLEILPLRDKDIDSFLEPPLTGCPENFTYLFEQLVQEIKSASFGTPVMYFETEYHGGAGGPKERLSMPMERQCLVLLGVSTDQ